MPKTVIIEVSYDGQKLDYRLWPTSLAAASYGTVLADLALQISRMLASEGGFDRDELNEDIRAAFLQEMKHPQSTMSFNQLQ